MQSGVRCIERLRPKAFLFENVKGLPRPSFAKYFEYITLRLAYPDCGEKRGEDWTDHLNRANKSLQPTVNPLAQVVGG